MKTINILLAAIFAAAPFASSEELVKGMNKIPAAAAEGLKKYAADHSMKIEKVFTTKHGKVTVYEAELTAPGQPNHEVAVTADGSVKGEEETVPLESVPEAVRHSRIHIGHCTWLEPDERKFVTPERIRAASLVGSGAEILEQLEAMERAGLSQVMLLPSLERQYEALEDVSRDVLAKM